MQSQNAHSTKFAVVAQLVEHQLPKLRVAGSNPVYRSNRALAQTVSTQPINSANHINPQKRPESFEGVFLDPLPKTCIIYKPRKDQLPKTSPYITTEKVALKTQHNPPHLSQPKAPIKALSHKHRPLDYYTFFFCNQKRCYHKAQITFITFSLLVYWKYF